VITMLFRNRVQAGRALAGLLGEYADREDVLVLGLPRGGVPVAYEVAVALHAPLDVFLVRKLGVPGAEEVAMGAIASGGLRVLDVPLIRRLQIPAEAVDLVTRAEERELKRRERAYRADRPPLQAAGRTVILVDDGLATGASMRAAISAVRRLGPRAVVVAVPVAPHSAREDLSPFTDRFVCVATPEPFMAVGRFYEDFEQTTDEEVRALLERPIPVRRMEAAR
jgi:predicted phosphoribosyltransferase